MAEIEIERFRVEQVRQDARHLISGDFKMVGQSNAHTPLLRAAFESGDAANFAFDEAGERLTFPAFVTFFDETDGVITAVLRPAGAPA